jgi:hypothetical protein
MNKINRGTNLVTLRQVDAGQIVSYNNCVYIKTDEVDNDKAILVDMRSGFVHSKDADNLVQVHDDAELFI